MTVARGMGGEGSVGCVANGHMTVGHWGKGGGGGGGGGRGRGGGPRGGPSSIKPVGWPRALKKIEIRPGPAR